MAIINFENVSYQNLSEVNLSVQEGEFLAVMGKNGSGKSTLCKLINGIIPHSEGGNFAGNVIVDGINTKESSVPVLSLKAGIVFDDPDTQIFTDSVQSEVSFGPENMKVSLEEIKERVRQFLSYTGLTGFEDRLPSTLSGGEKQRLVIASSLAMKSKILVLDEPLSRLDPEGAIQIMQVLKKLQTQYGITIIMAAHETNLIKQYADRVCILNNGKIVSCDTTDKILLNQKLPEENGIQPPQEINIDSYFCKKEFKIESGEPFALLVKKCKTLTRIKLSIKNLSFSYENNLILNNINFNFNENEITAIIGPNGCGKTTLLKCIAGLLKPAEGDIILDNKNIKQMKVSKIARDVGFIMQNPDNQLFTDSVYKEVAFALKNKKLKKHEIDNRVTSALDTVGLKDKDAFPHALSRADKTKLVIACVLAMGSKTILFDEVDVGNDYAGCIKIMELARKLANNGYTIIFVSHNLSLVCKYADRLIEMKKDGTINDMTRKDAF